MSVPFLLGVLGGMGPLATVDFLAKLVAATPAAGDADHVPQVTVSIPQIPSRVAAILRGGESPLPALLAARDRLLAAGATHLAMPCNTAYHWYDALVAGCDRPFLHIADAAVAEVATRVERGSTVGVIATEATHAIGLYAARLERAGGRAVVLGCTEVPPGLAAAGATGGVPLVDPTDALARACVSAWTASRVEGTGRPVRPSGLDRAARAL